MTYTSGILNYKTSYLDRRTSVLERRRVRRFKVEWDVTVKGQDITGASLDEVGRLENLSSGGAFLYLTKCVKVGTQLDVWIKVPFKRENWMKYSAEVVRVESLPQNFGVAMKFDSARPAFVVK